MGFFMDVIRDSRLGLSKEDGPGSIQRSRAEERSQISWESGSQPHEEWGRVQTVPHDPSPTFAPPFPKSQNVPSTEAFPRFQGGEGEKHVLSPGLEQHGSPGQIQDTETPFLKESAHEVSISQERFEASSGHDTGKSLRPESESPADPGNKRVGQQASRESGEPVNAKEPWRREMLSVRAKQEDVLSFSEEQTSTQKNSVPERGGTPFLQENTFPEEEKLFDKGPFPSGAELETIPPALESSQERPPTKVALTFPVEGETFMAFSAGREENWQPSRQNVKSLEPGAPRVRIGQVNVIVQGQGESGSTSPNRGHGEDLASRTFLRSL